MSAHCYLCGAEPTCGEVYFSFEARCVCADCADGITAEDLMHVTGARSIRGMLTQIGFVRESR
ncbi:MAG: hypothetical protein IJW51_01965 [Clostridia bacterium]|nr:hypothetical protein [Clostridia bacterium]